jgi:hypothetical protein
VPDPRAAIVGKTGAAAMRDFLMTLKEERVSLFDLRLGGNAATSEL